MPTPLDQLPGGVTGLARKVRDLERQVTELRAARRLGAAAFQGALRVVDDDGNTVAEVVSDLAGRAALVAYDTRNGSEFYAALTAGDVRFGIAGETDAAGEGGVLFSDLGSGIYEVLVRSGSIGGQAPAMVTLYSESAPAAGDAEVVLNAHKVRVTGTLRVDGQAPVSSVQAGSFTANSTTYTTATASGSYVDCAVVFTAPPSGTVYVSVSARLFNAATSGSLVSPETRTGGVIGAGTVLEGASDGIGVSHYGAAFARSGIRHLLSGLTPGETYNTRLLHRTTTGTDAASIALRELIIEPA